MSESIKDYLMLHLIVLIWGFTAILGLLISLPAIELVFYRTLIAAVGVAGIFLLRKKSILMPFPEMIKVAGIGVVIGMHWILFSGQLGFLQLQFVWQVWRPHHSGLHSSSPSSTKAKSNGMK